MSEFFELLEFLVVMLLGICTLVLPIVLLGVGLNEVDKKYQESSYTCPHCHTFHYFVREIDGVECCVRCGKPIKGE